MFLAGASERNLDERKLMKLKFRWKEIKFRRKEMNWNLGGRKFRWKGLRRNETEKKENSDESK